jgi:AraC family transcriptional regulator of adaptative response / DNA-3-methyladenine glycosylase II
VIEDPERCYEAAKSKDARFDGWFFCAVTSTGIYCRPSCPARTPKRGNMRFYPTAATAQQAGFRACLRCRPDATPGSPEWNLRADVVARAMRLIRDGIVDREGVDGLASRLGYSTRQLNRLITAEVGTGPLALARAQRGQTARVLLETTDLAVAHVAFAAGFASVRQCNDTIRQIFAETPSGLRHRAARAARGAGTGHHGAAERETAQSIHLRLPYRRPFTPHSVLDFLCARVLPGVESGDDGSYRRSLGLPHGYGLIGLTAPSANGLSTNGGPAYVEADLRLSDLRDLSTAVARCRQLLDLDADPVAVWEALRDDPLVGAVVESDPGRRVPGAADGFELAVRAVIGQQVSVAGARTVAGKLVRAAGETLPEPDGGVTHLFPTPEALARLAQHDPDAFAMPAGRRRALGALAEAVASGEVVIDPGSDPREVRRSLVSLPGIGPWTAEYVAMRALRDPDAFMPTDLGIRRAAAALALPDDPAHLLTLSEGWRPWRSYAMTHLWSLAAASAPAATRPAKDRPMKERPTKRPAKRPMKERPTKRPAKGRAA